MENAKVYAMSLEKVFSCLVAKAERKGRTREEVMEITSWLTGYSGAAIQSAMDKGLTYGEFFISCPSWNEKASLVKGKICGIEVSEIEDPLMKRIRILDKLVDELSKGKSMDKILRR